MAVTKNNPAEDTSSREIVVSRVFDAPRELVWQAMTDPQHVIHWWGPRGFSTTIETMDVRTGGTWSHVMRGPDGAEYPNKSIFTEVIKPERIVYSHGGGKKGGTGVHFISAWTFETVDGNQTRLTIRMVFKSEADRDRVVQEFGALEGARQTLARLAEHLPAMAASDREVVSTRVLDAPRERVYEAFSDPVQLIQWWGPKGFTSTFHEFDLRPGGAWRLILHGPDGVNYDNEKTFLEVSKPERIVFRHGHATHDFRMTMDFAVQDGQTRLTWRLLFDSPAEYAKVKNFVLEANEQNFDRLAAHLAARTWRL